MYINKAIIVGNLTRDPELRSMPTGNKVCSFGVATNRVWKDKDGQKQEDTNFHNIVVFGRQGENCGQYLKKGQSVAIEGRIQTRSWEGQDGQKKYRTDIIADRVQFGSKTQGGGSDSNKSAPQADDQSQEAPPDDINYPEEEINPEDIPF